MRASVAVFLLAWIALATTNEESGEDVHFTNSWAVHIENDDIDLVNDIAKKHGFVNQGQIGSLPGYYHFVKHSVGERSRRSLDEHSETLLSEPRVKWVEQQRILERSKRDVIPGEDELVERAVARLRRDTAVTIRDPFYKDQWYLQNIGQSSGPRGIDINVLPVWAQGYSGKGVVVSVLDDGVDHSHPDLKNNYDADASFDFNDFDGDPRPRDDNLENCHGTKCAGEVAAQADNGICGVGVSFNASIGGIRMLDGKATDTIEGSSLSYRADYIDIYSCCWGPKDDGTRFGKPGYLAGKALQIGAERGRGGKGNIYVWATGNGGLTDDDCNCDGYTTSIYTISIGAISDHGLSTYYTETCASTLAVTFSGGSHRETVENKVVTTDLHHKCTEVFKGTSSAAPLAAGMLALVLEANPRLTWRDVQHVIVESSQVTSPLDEGWKTNGAGKRYNHKFGFGRLDVSKMVNKALTWKNVEKQKICHGAEHSKKRYIPSSGSLILSANTSACSGTSSEIRRVEHVQLNVTLQHRHRGDLSITLISPSGTRSQLLTTRRNDHSARGIKSWLFMTVHCWGEDPRGPWTVIVTDNDNNNRQHYLEKHTQADEEDVTRVLMDETEEHRLRGESQREAINGHAQDHVLKTMEDTAEKIFNRPGFSKYLQRKKSQHESNKLPAIKTQKNGLVRHHKKEKEIHSASLKNHYWKNRPNNIRKVGKAKQNTAVVSRKKTPKNSMSIKHDKNWSKTRKPARKTVKHEKSNVTLTEKLQDGKTVLTSQQNAEEKPNATLAVVPFLVKSLSQSNASMLKVLNTSENAKVLDLITKLVLEIQKNPLVTKIAMEALKNPAIGELFGIDPSQKLAETFHESLSSRKDGKQIKGFKNSTSALRSSLNNGNQIDTRKAKLDKILNGAKKESSYTGPNEKPEHFESSRAKSPIKPGKIQFFKILRKTGEKVASGGESSGSGGFIDSGSGENLQGSGSGSVKGWHLENSQLLGSRKTQIEDASGLFGSGETSREISEVSEREENLSSETGGKKGDNQYEDGDGENFFENMKKAFESDEEGDLGPEFGLGSDSVNEYYTDLCRNITAFPKNGSSITRRLHCSQNHTQNTERDQEDKTLAHYLAVDKLKSTSGGSVLESFEDQDDSSLQSSSLREDKNPNGDQQEYADSRYSGKDLEVLQKALEEQLSRLSKDPESKKSNADFLARVRDDINHADINDLELLEAQIADGKTDISRVARSLSPEDEDIDVEDYSDTPLASYAEITEISEDKDELERSRISRQFQKHKSSQTYYVDPEKYGKDNSGILESWTLILYGTK